MRNFLFLVLLSVGVCFSQSYYMKIESNDGNQRIFLTDNINKISFLSSTGATTVNLSFLIVDNNFKPIPYATVGVVNMGSPLIEACRNEFDALNPNPSAITNSQGEATLTINLPACYDELSGHVNNADFAYITVNYRDNRYGGNPMKGDLGDLPGGCSIQNRITKNMCTNVTYVLRDVILP